MILSLKNLFVLFLVIKVFGILITFIGFNHVNENIFNFQDLKNYKLAGFLQPNPNIGFTFILFLFNINNAFDLPSIFLAVALSFLRDFIIVYFIYKKVDPIASIISILLISFHPYIAIYSIKFTTGIFTSIAVFLILFKIKYENFKLIYFIPLALIDILCRNFTTFIFASFSIICSLKSHKTKVKFLYIILAIIFLIFGFLVSGPYLQPQIYAAQYMSPLGIDSVQTLFGIVLPNNQFMENFMHVFGRIVLLFGGRDKYFVYGFESILEDHFLVVTLLFGFFFINVFSFIISIREGFKFFGLKGISIYFPLILTIFSVAHMRQLAPYLPFMMAALSIFLYRLFFKNKNSDIN